MKRLLLLLAAAAVIGAAALWQLSAVSRVDPSLVEGLRGDVARGELAFNLGGCASCHAPPDVRGEGRLVLSGGRKIASPFGTFLVPNISPDPVNGIGSWSNLDFVNAMVFGTGRDGQHLYPAFPYTSYRRAAIGDIVDLKAYMDTLPAISVPSQPHELPFPFNIRRSLGLWKLMFLRSGWVMNDDALSPLELRGRELVEGLGHCSECHTPRNILGGAKTGQWLQGAPNPSGKGRIPDLTPHVGGLEWSAADIAEYLTSGFTPEFDTAGGEMADVVENISKLPAEDRTAIAAYLKALPGR